MKLTITTTDKSVLIGGQEFQKGILFRKLQGNILSIQSIYERVPFLVSCALEDGVSIDGVLLTEANADELLGKLFKGGGTSPLTTEGFEDPLWFDIRKVIKEAPYKADFEAIRIQLIVASSDDTVFYMGGSAGAQKIITSDGVEYNNINHVTHVWDKSADKISSSGYKTRYFIEYYNGVITRPCEQNCLYFIQSKGHMNWSPKGANGFWRLIAFDFIDGANTSLMTDFSGFCSNCFALRKLPSTLDVSNGVNFASFCYICYSLQSLPSLNLSKGTVFSNFCAGGYSLANLRIESDLPLSINLSFALLSGEILVELGHSLQPKVVEDAVIITFGAALLAKMTDEDKLLFTTKGYTLA